MNIRHCTVLAVLLAAPALFAAEPADRPNIVVILADDLGCGDLGCYNKDSKIPTPHMDRLAADGIRFGDAHSPSAVCTPTRYGLLTGRYCWRTRLKQGVLQGYDPLLIEPTRQTLPALLKKHGYNTAGVGKWHLGLGDAKVADYSKPLRPGPNAVGFDYYFGIPSSLDFPPYVFIENEQCVEQPTDKIAGSKSQREGGAGYWREGAIAPSFKHIDVLPELTRKAIAHLEKQAKEGKPFFLYLPLSAPHTPWLPTRPHDGESKAGPYGDFVTQVDATVGEVLATLGRLKVRDNTLVILTSDNGAHWTADDIKKYDHRANLNWRGQKADIWEAGHRIPFIARWPGKIKPGAISSQTICLSDIFATAAALAGEKLADDAGEDSFNLLPALLEADLTQPIRPHIIHHSGSGLFAIRQGDWKLIDGLGSGGFTAPRTEKPTEGGPLGQLYNLADDPGERTNLYREKPDVVKRLKELLEKIKNEGRSRS